MAIVMAVVPLLLVIVAGLSLGIVLVLAEQSQILKQQDEIHNKKIEAEKSHADARRQRDVARRAVDEMYTLVAQNWLGQQTNLQPLQRDFLQKALEYYQEFASEKDADPSIRTAAAWAYLSRGRHRAPTGEACGGRAGLPAGDRELRGTWRRQAGWARTAARAACRAATPVWASCSTRPAVRRNRRRCSSTRSSCGECSSTASPTRRRTARSSPLATKNWALRWVETAGTRKPQAAYQKAMALGQCERPTRDVHAGAIDFELGDHTYRSKASSPRLRGFIAQAVEQY